MPTIDDMYFAFGPKTEALARTYLIDLQSGRAKPGKYLDEELSRTSDNDFLNRLDPNNSFAIKEFIAALMRTRKPHIFAESGVYGEAEKDWSLVELQILSNVSFNAPQMLAFNDGAWGFPHAWTDHPEPLPLAMAFVSGALLRNDTSRTGESYDTARLIKDRKLNFEEFYQHYEEKLLPVLLTYNHLADLDNKKLVVNVPGLGCSQFAGPYEAQIRAALPRACHQLKN